MDVRITPISRLIPLSKSSPNINSVHNRNRFSSLNISGPSGTNRNSSNHSSSNRSSSNISGLNSSSPNRTSFVAKKIRLDKPQYLIPAKSLRSNTNNLLLISKKNTNSPQLSLKITPNINQTPNVSGEKKVLLYQQIERNKLFSNNSELVNRFNFKA